MYSFLDLSVPFFNYQKYHETKYMPFRSKAQLRSCYSQKEKRKGNWDCDLWLKETKSVCNLPERSSSSRENEGRPSLSRRKTKKKSKRVSESTKKIKGPIQTGPRGGRFFIIQERDERGKICEMKIYLSSLNKS
jgi:hypothetical protein